MHRTRPGPCLAGAGKSKVALFWLPSALQQSCGMGGPCMNLGLEKKYNFFRAEYQVVFVFKKQTHFKTKCMLVGFFFVVVNLTQLGSYGRGNS